MSQSESAAVRDTQGRSRRAVAAILLAILCFSLTPMIMLWGEAERHAWALNAAWRTGVGLVSLLWLVSWGRCAFARAGGWRAVVASVREPRHWWLWAVLVLVYHDYFFLATANRASELAVVAVIYNTYPLFGVAFLGLWFRRERRYRAVRASTWAILVGAWGFLALVIASEHGTLAPAQDAAGHWRIAIALALVAAVLGALHTANLKLAAVIVRAPTGRSPAHAHTARQTEFAMVVAVNAAVSVVVACGSATAASLAGEAFLWAPLAIVVAGTALSNGIGALAWRYALFETRHPEIGIFTALTPALSFTWLTLASAVDVREPLWLVAGLLGLVATNVFVQLRIRRSRGTRA